MNSLGRIGAIARNTLTDLTRLKVFYFILVFALLLIGSSTFAVRLTFQQELQVLKDIGLGAISIFSSLLAVLTTARLLPQDVEQRTVYTILAKPVYRIEYLLGRLGGVVLLLAITVFAMSALFVAVLATREQTLLAATQQQMAAMPADQVQAAVREVHAAGLNTALAPAIALLFIKACVLATLTLLISTFATSNIFTIVTVVLVYLIGHLQGAAREYWLNDHGGAGFLPQIFLVLVALCFPDLQLFNVIDDVAAGAAIPLALFAHIALLGGFYGAVYLLLAWAAFQRREL